MGTYGKGGYEAETGRQLHLPLLLRKVAKSLRRELELLARDSAKLEETDQCFFDQVVRTRRAGGDSDDGRTRRQPEMGNDFAFLMQIVMLDLVLRDETRRVEHEVGRQF